MTGDSPRQRIEAEAARRGRQEFAHSCAAILRGGEIDTPLLRVLAGRSSNWFLTDADERSDYWARVWAARGLLWAWDDVALPAVVAALDDGSWRVREMSLKVVARHRLDDALTAAAELRGDPVPRVRAAAVRAVTMLTVDS